MDSRNAATSSKPVRPNEILLRLAAGGCRLQVAIEEADSLPRVLASLYSSPRCNAEGLLAIASGSEADVKLFYGVFTPEIAFPGVSFQLNEKDVEKLRRFFIDHGLQCEITLQSLDKLTNIAFLQAGIADRVDIVRAASIAKTLFGATAYIDRSSHFFDAAGNTKFRVQIDLFRGEVGDLKRGDVVVRNEERFQLEEIVARDESRVCWSVLPIAGPAA